MIAFEKFRLNNGLRILVHPDPSTHLAAVNILYDVGARDENPDRTGFAHLFEHLMFEGSENIRHYDRALEVAGGTNNAFTNNDITNYYLSLPAMNLETAFWLESDRMKALHFSEEKLAVQKNVVVEEFKQRYLNQPYADAWLQIRPLAYTSHPYQWPTIGKSIAHIEDATLDEVKSFFYKHYRPRNAIMVVAGAIEPDEVFRLTEKWFGDIPSGDPYVRNLPREPAQDQRRELVLERDVPYDAIYMAWKMPPRTSAGYYRGDLITDLLSSGHSSRLYVTLVREKKLFSDIQAYTTGEMDGGLLMISGKLKQDVSIEQGEKAIWEVLNGLKLAPVDAAALDRVKNRVESIFSFGQMDVVNRAMELALFEWMGDGAYLNQELKKYFDVTPEQIREEAESLLTEHTVSVIHYKSKQTS
ncbi:MAG: insulinase family protein [Flavobacteriales bacterium]|nr:insulinase family protein [Flavobacteriales bacterium]MCB9448876.1 insulinase family protein [Flavobacteriales bacterium]